MTRRLLVLFASASLFAVSAQAAPIYYRAVLRGSAEAPPNASPGIGFAAVDYDPVAHSLLVDVVFRGLTVGNTASHIHCCTAVPDAGTVGVATPTPTFPGFPTGATSGSYLATLDLTMASSFRAGFLTASGGTPAGAEAALAAGLAANKAYLNIHTTTFPGGEIRGFLHVPEPTVLGPLGLALGALAVSRRRRLA